MKPGTIKTIKLMNDGRSLKIQFNQEIIDRVKQNNIQMDLMGSVMFVLFGLFEDKLELLDHADDMNKQRRMIVLYRQLEHRGLLELDTGGKALYRLTPKGNELVTYLKEQYDEELNVEATESETEVEQPKKSEDPIGGWITEWINIFPNKNEDGRLLKVHPLGLISKMRKFMDQYKFDKETILKATKAYIDAQARSVEGHKYTRSANYFIMKDKGQNYTSDLADWCQRVVDGNTEDEFPDTRMMDMV